MLMNEITIFKPNSRKKEATISSPVDAKVVSVLEERLGAEAAKQARSAFNTLKRNDFEFLQFRLDARRIRVKRLQSA